MREYGRMIEAKNNIDFRAAGGNPCFEQTLESYELCCLTEVFLNNNSNEAEIQESLELAFKFAKYITLTQTHWPQTNEILMRNRRIGCSLSGIA